MKDTSIAMTFILGIANLLAITVFIDQPLAATVCAVNGAVNLTLFVCWLGTES